MGGWAQIHSSAIVVIRWFWMTFLTSFSSEFICRQIMSWILAPPLFDKEQLFCLVVFRRGKWGTGHSVIHPLTWGLLALFLLPWWEFTMQCICWDSSLHWKPTNTFSWSWRADSQSLAFVNSPWVFCLGGPLCTAPFQALGYSLSLSWRSSQTSQETGKHSFCNKIWMGDS